jgi:tetratricopeptide (TPR) repeat protein
MAEENTPAGVPHEQASGANPVQALAEDKPIAIAPVPPEAGGATVVAPAPTPKAPMTAAQLAAEIRRLDLILITLVTVLAFFLASFAAHNSDLWMHLATGRLLASGEHTFGIDPFSYTSEGNSWINHSWLYDLISYHVFNSLGGPDESLAGAALVLGKALAVAALALVMMLISRPRQSYWLPATCTAVALLAMYPRLLLQPSYFSYLFLGLTLLILYRSGVFSDARPWGAVSADEKSGSAWMLFLLPILFALWVNLDDWFVLGPITVAIALAAEGAQRMFAPREQRSTGNGRLGLVAVILVVSCLACLASPYHLRGLTLPQEIWTLLNGGALQTDVWLQSYFFQGLGRENLANPSSWPYVALAIMGLASFAATFPDLRYWRVALWAAFMLLSAALARAVPFFAVVAAPIAALNFQDFAIKRFGPVPKVEGDLKSLSLGGRLATILAAVVLLVAAWPGWLLANADDARRTRRVTWAVDVDPSFRQACAKIAELRQQGVFGPEDRGFNWLPDFANYCAWFCPEEKGFFDYRFQIFPEAAATYVEARQSFLPPKEDETAPEELAWEKVFKDPRFHINHLVVNFADSSVRERTVVVMKSLWLRPDDWSMLYLDGRTCIFGWKKGAMPSRREAFQSLEINPSQLAFAGDLAEEARAPKQGPQDPVQKRSIWATFLNGPPPRPLALDEAALYVDYYETMLRFRQRVWPAFHSALRWLTPWPEVLGRAGGGAAPIGAPGTIATLGKFDESGLVQRSAAGPAAPLILAIRACRRAILESPDYGDNYYILALAYKSLWSTQEAVWTNRGRASLLKQIRLIEIVNALQTALNLKPELMVLHSYLAESYQDLGYIDLELDEREEYLKAMRAKGPGPRDTPEGYEHYLSGLENQIRQREKETDIQHLRNDFELRTANLPPLAKAQYAIRYGFYKTALDALREMSADPATFRQDEAELLVQLMITSGQAEEVRRAEFVLKDWFTSVLALVSGDYKAAENRLNKMAHNLISGKEETNVFKLLLLARANTFQGVTQEQLSEMNQFVADYFQGADYEILHGAIALEAGDNQQAADHFQKGLDMSNALLRPGGAAAPLAAANFFEALSIMATQNLLESEIFVMVPSRPVARNYLDLLARQGVVPAAAKPGKKDEGTK